MPSDISNLVTLEAVSINGDLFFVWHRLTMIYYIWKVEKWKTTFRVYETILLYGTESCCVLCYA